MEQYIPKDALVTEIKSRISDIEISQKAGLIKKRDADKKILLFKSVLSLIDTVEVIEIGVDLGDPKGDKSAIHIIDTKTLEVKEVDLEKLGAIARHLIAVKEHIEDMRLDKEVWFILEKIGYPERFKVQKGE